MQKITKFDRETCRLLRSELQVVLSKFGLDAGLEFEVGGISFLEDAANIKLSTKVVGAKTIKEQRVDDGLKHMTTIYNLTTDLKNGRQLVGYNSRAKAYPFIYVQNGVRYKCSVDHAKLYFGAPVTKVNVVPTKLSPEEIRKRFVDLACRLSPENLSCDGELSRSQVAARHTQIKREWAELENLYGSTVTEDQAWAFSNS